MFYRLSLVNELLQRCVQQNKLKHHMITTSAILMRFFALLSASKPILWLSDFTTEDSSTSCVPVLTGSRREESCSFNKSREAVFKVKNQLQTSASSL